MSGSLLVSGNPQHYKAIGEGGQPVYAVAFQLREAIRLKAGASTANCLAIPQSNQYGSMVDWYSPIEGEVVPWTAASSQEREHALARLDTAHRTLESAIAKMRLAEARDGKAEREKNTVLPLMSKVFYFPDTNFIYLVNGEPVIAFWGFHTQAAGLPSDPFVSLRPVSPNSAQPVLASVNEPVRRSWWWWLLLMLLLLLLLFFLLRGCAPVSLFGFWQTPEVTVPSTPSSTIRPLQNAPSTGPVDPSVRSLPDGWIDRGVSTVRRWWSGGDTNTGVAVPGVGADVASNVETPAGQAPATETPAAPLAPPQPPVSPELPNGQTNTAAPDSQQQPPRSDETSAQPAQPLGQPLSIPQQALQSGDTRFLDGSWTAGTGIQDAKTGKPLRIEYDFSQGKGQGKVTIRRADGSQCVGAVSAQIQGQSLQINDQGVAKCSDGGTIALPKVTCLPQPNGQANCQGRYENGATFPVSMRHAPK